MEQILKIKDGCLNILKIEKHKIEIKNKRIHYIFNVDVSGSMSYELPHIRKQLKNKIADLAGVNNTFTIIWFSGRNQCGIIKEGVEISNAEQLQKLHTAIDKFLVPVGLTAFADPIKLANDLISRLKTADDIISYWFLTDGYNNDSSWSDVKSNLKQISDKINSASFIEFGYYADSKALNEMSEICGGETVFAKDFDDYDEFINRKIKNSDFCKKVAFEIPKNIYTNLKYDFCFSVFENDIISYKIEDKTINVLENDNIIFFTKNVDANTEYKQDLNKYLYSAAYILADKMKYSDVKEIIRLISDSNLFTLLAGAYGKQKLNEFKTELKSCVFDNSKRYLKGNGIPEINNYSLMDLLLLLQNDENNKVFPQHKDFNYKRIGIKREAKDEVKSVKEKLLECNTKEEMENILNSSTSAEFIITDKNRGYSLKDLVFNESRANLSFRVRYDGCVRLGKNSHNIEEVNSFIYRTYTLIKDGILNVSTLPVMLSEHTLNTIKEKCYNVLLEEVDGITILDLSKLPIINESIVDNVSAKELALLEYNLIKLQSSLKVYKDYNKNLNPKENKNLLELFGEEACKFLNELGITDYNGFSPKTTAVESGDGYMAVELNTKIKGLSSIPSVNAVNKKLAENKSLTFSEKLLEKSIIECENLMNNPLQVYEKQLGIVLDKDLLTEDKKVEITSKVIESATKTYNKDKNKLMSEISKTKFGIILSRQWFKEFNSFDENKLEVELDGSKIEVVFELKEVFEKV